MCYVLYLNERQYTILNAFSYVHNTNTIKNDLKYINYIIGNNYINNKLDFLILNTYLFGSLLVALLVWLRLGKRLWVEVPH